MSLPAVFARHLPSSKPFLCHDRQTITYDEFDSITSFLANRLFQLYGPRPTLAFLSENNPYMLALMLSVWKLGGIVSPMDMRSPAPILQEMLRITEPHAVVVCKDEVGLVHLVRGAYGQCDRPYPWLMFHPKISGSRYTHSTRRKRPFPRYFLITSMNLPRSWMKSLLCRPARMISWLTFTVPLPQPSRISNASHSNTRLP